MNVSGLLAILTGLLLASGPLSAAPPAPLEDAAIRSVAAQWQEDWNAHDMHAMATLLDKDADFVNVAGLHWKGRSRIEGEHAQRHRSNLKNSVWVTRNITVQGLSPGFALVHLDWGISGDTDFDGTPRAPREGIFSWLMVKRGNAWLIRSAHNTNKSPAK